MKTMRLKCITLLLGSVVFSVLGNAEPKIQTFKLPYEGIRPQAAIDEKGMVHIVQSDSKIRGKVVYVKHDPGKNTFSQPIEVLRQAKDMAAGYNMALGKNGRVHVLTRPTPKYSRETLGEEAFLKMFNSKERFFVLRYMLHSRLNNQGTAFEDERNFVGDTIGFEGVGALATDPQRDQIYAFWGGQLAPGPEMGRDLYMAISNDEGASWSTPKKLDIDIDGNCRCCPIQASVDAQGNLYVIHRNSVKTSATSWDKDTYLLTSEDQGKSWSKTLIQKWENCGCPGAPYSMANGPDGVVFGFSTRGVSSFAAANDPKTIIPAPDTGNARTRPNVSVNSKGEVMFCWVEVQDVVWQVFDKQGKALPGTNGRLEGVAAKWSNAAVVSSPNDDFMVYYDGFEPHPPAKKR